MADQEAGRVRCQRIGCTAIFSEDDNPEGCCQYHDGAPIFHDGMKEWSCCMRRSHDFSLFLEIPGCKKGKHTPEKPVLLANPKKVVSPTQLATNSISSSKDYSCTRCRQGFFCSDHGSQAKQINATPANSVANNNIQVVEDIASAPHKKYIVDINQTQTCRNKGCRQTFKEKDNHATACNYHPGPAVFHDRMKRWNCCNIHVKEFDEFMSIPPCTEGWHNADALS
ncbi:cysteine and histidine-rich domain-containing protein RAR1-like [Ziziphus jujuba]|uniref:Cysteine and histidine-rich domain-containing protein RAR1-like n=1 Tax=Ziziphus jujuba TaxID=326968 RepID=A0A6P4ABN5_ZIZJJ|nr:cysteine and histidine-rich domain-containing protein RAR1-like [Ziziphus jujuba]